MGLAFLLLVYRPSGMGRRWAILVDLSGFIPGGIMPNTCRPVQTRWGPVRRELYARLDIVSTGHVDQLVAFRGYVLSPA